VYSQDVGMLKAGGELDLSLEALGAEAGCELGQQDLERDRAIVPEIMGEVDRGHPPPPELTLEHVAVAQGVRQFGSCPLDHGETWAVGGTPESGPLRHC
jgi:hypothetical protein